jgi:trk system potassium uptake protein TrkA
MKIIICGAGLSGRAIAEKLSQIGNEVTIIDSSKRLIEKLGSKLDIRGIVGHGAHPDICRYTFRRNKYDGLSSCSFII